MPILKKNSRLTSKAVKKLKAAQMEQLIDDKIIEYVIYVRKSTEDTSGERQAQSIADQIERCVNYAKDNNLIIKKKPAKFEFETDEEIEQEDKDKDIKNRRIYQETRNLYIIKERMSGSTLGRPKWNKLIDKIRNGEIKGLISYSPDRQARNMVDG
jgi:DNA invertase Pin-like site-specific DNA recombinase